MNKKLICWSQSNGYYETALTSSMDWLMAEDVGYTWLEWRDLLEKHGYRSRWRAGSQEDGSESIDVYFARAPAEGVPPYLFDISGRDGCEQIAVWTKCDALGLRDRLFGRFGEQRLFYFLERLTEVAEKGRL